MVEKTCCVTGCREIPEKKREYVKRALRAALLEALADGYTRFLLRLGSETEWIFTALAEELRQQGSKLFLEVVVPNADQLKEKDPRFQEALGRCDGVRILWDQSPPGWEFLCCRWLVKDSSRVIAVWDGQEVGNSLQILRTAHAQEKPVRFIPLERDTAAP